MKSADDKEARFAEAKSEVKHPDIAWAERTVKDYKGDRVTDKELETIWWNGLMGCYLMQWRGMTLGIETDGHIHS
jgi:hypothetical protein